MNTAVVKNALGELHKVLSQAKSALRQLEAETFGFRVRGESGLYDNPGPALGYHLQELHDVLLVVLEAAEMPGTRSSLVESWKGFATQDEGLQHTINNGEYETCGSPAFNALERIIQGLHISVSGELSTEEAWKLNKLEEILYDTAGLVHSRKIQPKKEVDLQRVMHDYLRAFFSDFVLNLTISGTIKNFKPDYGITSLGAAIEFKIARSKEDVALAFSGIAEDTAGYQRLGSFLCCALSSAAVHATESFAAGHEADWRCVLDTNSREWASWKD